jgi:hypothetical protein
MLEEIDSPIPNICKYCASSLNSNAAIDGHILASEREL